MRRLCLILCCLAGFALAAPERYQLDAAQSEVVFTYTFEGSGKKGKMPIQSADVLLDLDDIAASKVTVTLNAARAKAGFVIATDIMKSPEVLHTAAHPTIRFQSTRFQGDLSGATVTGDLTIRGVTHPVTLQAELFRQRGTDVDDRRNLSILLTGSINRRDFSAGGYPGFVGPEIGLRILAQITR